METPIKTVMFIDIVDYTSVTNLLNKNTFSRYHDNFDRIIKKQSEYFEGEIVKKIGDGFLLTFNDVDFGLLCALEIQKKCQEHTETNPELPLQIRIGMHHGMVIIKEKDVLGTTVNIASRIERMSRVNEVLFTAEVKKELKEFYPHESLGFRKIRGLKESKVVHRINTLPNADKQLTLGQF